MEIHENPQESMTGFNNPEEEVILKENKGNPCQQLLPFICNALTNWRHDIFTCINKLHGKCIQRLELGE